MAAATSKAGKVLLTVLFMLFFIASGHLLMVALNALDHQVSAGTYARQGVPGLWRGDESLARALKELQKKIHTSQQRESWQRAQRELHQTGTFHFTMRQVSPFLVATSLGLFLLGLGLLVASKWFEGETKQVLVGLFAGQFLWIGAVEYGLTIASRMLGVAKGLEFSQERIVGRFGEYVLLKHTWGLVLVLAAYLLFLEASRCPFFLLFRRHLRLMHGALATGRVDNYAPRVAFQYSAILWTFYVYLLLAYDPRIFGIRSWFTRASFFVFLATSGYLLMRLGSQPSFPAALRYAIGTTVVLWNVVEILAKWNIYREPWLVLQPGTALVFFGGLALGTWLVVREIRRSSEDGARA